MRERSVQSRSADIEENGGRLRLTVVDTPGSGDFVNNDDSWRPVVENIGAALRRLFRRRKQGR